MSRIRQFIFCLFVLACCFSASAQTNSLVWHKTSGRVDADVRDLKLPELLEKISTSSGWRVYVEPGSEHVASAKFKNETVGDALKMLLGDLNFALVPQTNFAPRLYVFKTAMQNATRLIALRKAKHVPNELLLRVKPGTDMNALAKMLGAKIVGHIDKFGIYHLQFADADAADSALAQLQNDSDVLDADYNYYFNPEPPSQVLSSTSGSPLLLPLNPPPDSGKVIIGLPDTAVQSLGNLDKFISKRISVADGESTDDGLNHGTGMAESILQGIASVQHNGTSAQIISADVYGSSETATTWNVALGIQAVINNGANVVNLSLGGGNNSPVLDYVIQAGIGDGILFFAAAGNQPTGNPVSPADIPGVNAVTALQQKNQLASYANYWNGVDMAFPGSSIVYLGNQAWLMQGTSVSTALATGIAVGNKIASGASWTQVQNAMQQKFAVPKN